MTKIIRLALPIAVTYLGLMTMGLVDLIMVGHIGTTATGAVGIGTSLFAWFMIFGIGLLAGMDFLVASAFGAGRVTDCWHTLDEGLRLATALAIPLTFLLYLISYHLDFFHFNAEILPESSNYLRILAFSLWPAYIFTSCRNYLQSVSAVLPPLVILLVANLLNAVMNYTFVFGHWGAPHMGASGSALATLISRFWMMSAIFLFTVYWNRKHIGRKPHQTREARRERMRSLLRLGLPAAGQMTLEVGVFATSTALAGTLDPVSLAAHQIVLNIASMTFMIPMGIGAATAVVVGQALGRGHRDEARHFGWSGLRFGSGFMVVSSLMLLLFATPILGIYTQDPTVLFTAKGLILIAGLFQISDGTQTVLTGALRGAADTRNPMFANLFGHWFLGLPLGTLLCFSLGYGIRGLWVGLAVGLTVVALWLTFTWARRSQNFQVSTSAQQAYVRP